MRVVQKTFPLIVEYNEFRIGESVKADNAHCSLIPGKWYTVTGMFPPNTPDSPAFVGVENHMGVCDTEFVVTVTGKDYWQREGLEYPSTECKVCKGV